MNRAQVGRYLASIAAAVSAGIVFLLLAAVDLAKQFGVPANVTPAVLSLVGAGSVFAALYWLFNKYVWRWRPIARLLKIPNLSGNWQCEGRTLNSDGSLRFEWKASVIIIQSWEKLRVRLRTDQSGSNSISAALVCDEADGHRLLYNYQNEPKIGEIELKAHRGFAEIIFNADGISADGEYFNGHGRFTFGTMHLTRI
jgi:hypothetical protein